jgi:hypothetical protein
VNKKELLQDINKFNRKIKLKAHFGTSLPKEGLYFKNESQWEPSNVHHTVKTFSEDLKNRVTESLNNDGLNLTMNRKNLSKKEEKAMNDLKNREDIVICKADKGGAVVITDVDDYVNEANRQLSDQRFYKKVEENPTALHAALVDNAIDNLKLNGHLEEKMAEQLKTNNPKTPRMYLLPKIHKPGNPGRPVVSSIGCHTERISKYVDHHLQPLNQNLESYVKDTTDFLKKLENIPEIPEEAVLVTMDVRSLYTNVPNDEGVEAVKTYLRNRNQPGDGILAKIISTFLMLILTLNNFVFNDQNYVQVNGASMGTKCAPTYASLFMGSFEERNILPKIRDSIMIYVRYIDDIFFIWKGTMEELEEFLKEINQVHPTIKFDHVLSKESINFLDVKVSILGKKLTSSVYTKPTDRKSYLHAKSYHPKSTKEAIAFGQATRLKRICTETTDFQAAANQLKADLIKRGHKEERTSAEINRAAEQERKNLLTYKERKTENRVPLVITYNRRLPKLKEIMDESWKLLGINNSVREKFPEKPLICYRRNRNLRDILGQTRISRGKVIVRKPEMVGGCSPCRARPDTKCCRHMVQTKFFTNRTKTKKFDIRQKLGCKSKDALYLAWCDKCNEKQYVGKVESQKAHRRINKHRNDAKKEGSINIDQHFREKDHDFNRDFRIIIIEEIADKNMTREQVRNTLLKREDFWIKKLDTLEPNGFNDKLNFPNV